MQSRTGKITVIGGGLAGSEAAYQIAKRGMDVELVEMRPRRLTPAHKTGNLAELVCSNSLKSHEPLTASGLLKKELELLGSLIMEAARESSIPGGSALTVDRSIFSQKVTQRLKNHPRVKVVTQEAQTLPQDRPVVIATGPLTSEEFSKELKSLLGEESLYFYDAIAPIVSYESIDLEHAFWASRYGKGGDDYLNCPLSKDEYNAFYQALVDADPLPLHSFEEISFFEGCQPIEEMARKGKKTLLYGPMKPVGLVDPKTGKRPYAVVQLRKENSESTMLNMVGFQTRLRYPDQKRVFSIIPALKNAEFLRYGSMHRNTYINSPRHLMPTLQWRKNPLVLFAGQITGVEGYLESCSAGLIAGLNAWRLAKGLQAVYPPPTTMMGALVRYITMASAANFQPMNANLGILPPLEEDLSGEERKRRLVERALRHLAEWKTKVLCD
jgi:methylenetetrahydrofolate--tRNA-(uracil-5-)-methyltransferase